MRRQASLLRGNAAGVAALSRKPSAVLRFKCVVPMRGDASRGDTSARSLGPECGLKRGCATFSISSES